MCEVELKRVNGNAHHRIGAQQKGCLGCAATCSRWIALQLSYRCKPSARFGMQVAEERASEAEARARELYECNKRLEVHVGVS